MEIERYEIDYSTPPIGYEFTSKKLTEKAKAKVSAYWINAIDAKETKDEYLDLMRKGDREYVDRIQWHNKYTFAYQRCIGWLSDQRFIRKIKS